MPHNSKIDGDLQAFSALADKVNEFNDERVQTLTQLETLRQVILLRGDIADLVDEAKAE